jgi:hypothetical protein
VSVVVDRVVLRALGARRLPAWTFDLGAGTHALVLTDTDVARGLSRVVAGVEAPKRGRVLVDGEEPYRAPALRARLGIHYGRDFTALGRASALDFSERVRELRGRHGVVTADPLGLVDPARLALPLAQLTSQERSDFELELALGVEKAPLVWLSRPPWPARGQVLERLRERASDGAAVVVVVGADREASLWGDQRHPPGQPDSEDRGRTIQLVVERPREVAAELQREAAVLGTELDPERPNVLLVFGTDELALRRACGTAVVARRCELSEMVSLPGRRHAASNATRGGP